MNGHTAIPAITFGPDCTYDTLDAMLNPPGMGYMNYGFACRLWLKQGFIITALWGSTSADDGDDRTAVMAWDEKKQDYCNPVEVPTDDITRVEIL